MLPAMLAAGGMQMAETAYSAYSANRANQKMRDMAGDQMVFQERMSSTAHQREVADLKAAGLNPILSANRGASSPAGASGGVVTPDASGIGDAATSAMEARRLRKEVEAVESQNALNKATAKYQAAAAVNQGQQAATAAAQARKLSQEERIIRNDAEVSDAEKGSRLQTAPFRPYLDAIGKALGIGVTAAGAAAGARAGAMRAPIPNTGGKLPKFEKKGGWRERPIVVDEQLKNRYYGWPSEK